MTKDWKGNSKSVHSILGASNHSEKERVEYDYYATPPEAVEMLLGLEDFSHKIWEPAAGGGGHITKILQENGYDVISTDIIERNFPLDKVENFLESSEKDLDLDIITNPPYKQNLLFIQKAIEAVGEGHKVAMFLKLQFLEGKARGQFFKKHPPRRVWVSRSRLNCGRNGEFNSKESSAVAYCWYIWEQGWTGSPEIKWFN